MDKWLKGKEHSLVQGTILALWEAQTKCVALPQHRANCIDSCRKLLMYSVNPTSMPIMERERLPNGDGEYTREEERLLAAAALGLKRVDKEVESLSIERRETLGTHAELIEDVLKLNEPKPEPTTGGQRRKQRSGKARGRRLLRAGGALAVSSSIDRMKE